MKRWGLLMAVLIVLLAAAPVQAGDGNKNCTRIQDGVLTYWAGHYLAGQPLRPGYDAFGYNYQAHLFNGLYANVYLGADGLPPYTGDNAAYLTAHPEAASKWYWEYRAIDLVMKWNDAWIANQDCDGDGYLDRHYGFPTYQGSGAWETVHMASTYEQDGRVCRWKESAKIIAVPADAVNVSGVWYTSAGTLIGPAEWGSSSPFALIQDVLNDPCSGLHGVQFVSPAHPGLGNW